MNNKNEFKIMDNSNSPVIFQGIAGEEITPSDTTILTPGSLFIGSGGNVTVLFKGGGKVTFRNIPDGTFLPAVVIIVFNTGTTASDIIILR